MLRKRSRSLQNQKDQQHHMGHLTTISDANLDNHSQSHAVGGNTKAHSVFNAPCLFVGLSPKGLLDSDSVRSPTSPLDARRVLSNLGNPVNRNPTRSSPHEGHHQRSWDCCKVGLGIVESLEDCCSRFCGKILPSPESKDIHIGLGLSPQMMIKTPICQTCMMDSLEASKSLPKDFCKVPYTQNTQNGSVIPKGEGESTVLFEIGETGLEHEPFGRTRSISLDSCISPLKAPSGLLLTTSKSDSNTENFALKDMSMNTQVSSPPRFIGGSQNSNTFPPTESKPNTVSMCSSNEFIMNSLSASEIELSEDYTCVISHGPNPKTTRFFGDYILGTHSADAFKNHIFKNEEEEKEKGVTLVVGNNRLQAPNQYPSSDFLSFCHHCNKKLEEGKDIYIYGWVNTTASSLLV